MDTRSPLEVDRLADAGLCYLEDLRVETTNQRSDLVQVLTAKLVVPRRAIL